MKKVNNMSESWHYLLSGATSIIVVLSGLVIKGQNDKIKEQSEKIDENERCSMTKATHTILCENASLRINEHLTHELTKFRDEIHPTLREIKDELMEIGFKAGGGKDG